MPQRTRIVAPHDLEEDWDNLGKVHSVAAGLADLVEESAQQALRGGAPAWAPSTTTGQPHTSVAVRSASVSVPTKENTSSTKSERKTFMLTLGTLSSSEIQRTKSMRTLE